MSTAQSRQDAGRKPSLSFPEALKYLTVGVYFGIVLVKAEVVSWYRIQEMFHFQSVHMYGVIGLAVVVGALSVAILKAARAKSVEGVEIDPTGKPFNKIGNPAGGLIFGFGWALTGACPGPLYAILGAGYWPILLAILSAILGVLTYGYLRPRLPH
ncbi:MAG: YeeE/YedE family protein [Spirochaetota bacterium]